MGARRSDSGVEPLLHRVRRFDGGHVVDFLTIGDTQFDTILILDPAEVDVSCRIDTHDCRLALDYASKIPVSRIQTAVAGNAANAAITGVRLGFQTALWSLLGDDDVANREIAYLGAEQINTTWLERVRGAQSHQSTVISVSGERTILVYHAPRTYQLPASLPRTPRWVYLTSLGPGSESLFPELVRYLAETRAKLAYQPGTFQLRLGAGRSWELLKSCSLIVMNKEEAQLYTSNEREMSLPNLCRALQKLGPSLAVVTDGTDGACAASSEGMWRMGIRPEVPRVESTGAGDAYASAFTLAIAEGEAVPDALRWGALNAESVIGQIGPQAGILDRATLRQQLAANPDFVATPVVSIP